MEDEKSRREASVLRYKEKRQTRLFSKKIRYQVRKLNADKRPRLKVHSSPLSLTLFFFLSIPFMGKVCVITFISTLQKWKINTCFKKVNTFLIVNIIIIYYKHYHIYIILRKYLY